MTRNAAPRTGALGAARWGEVITRTPRLSSAGCEAVRMLRLEDALLVHLTRAVASPEDGLSVAVAERLSEVSRGLGDERN